MSPVTTIQVHMKEMLSHSGAQLFGCHVSLSGGHLVSVVLTRHLTRHLTRQPCFSSVFVRYNLGPGVAVELQEEASVANLMEVVGSRQGVSPEQLRVLFAGRELPSTATLQVSSEVRLYMRSEVRLQVNA